MELIREKHISFVSAFALSAYLFGLELSEMQGGFCWPISITKSLRPQS